MLGCLLSARARAQPTRDLTRAVLELDVNGARVDDVIVLLGQDDVLVPSEALEQAGVVRLRSGRVQFRGRQYISLRRAVPSLTYELDERALLLRVIAPPSALPSTSVDLSARAPPGIWYSEEPSAYLSYAPSLADFSTFQAFSELGVSSGSALATSSMNYQLGHQPVRLLTRLSHSERENLREFTLGDIQTNTGPLGGTALVGGFGVRRNFDLDPYLVRVPELGYRGSVSAPSTVDVYVNGVLVRRAALAPGEFDLKGVAPVSGAGNVRYVIRDPFSRQADVSYDYYAPSGLLAPGLSEYAYTAGFARERFGVASFDYGKPLLLGRIRVGVSRRLTLGARAELGVGRVSGGSDLTLGGEFGEIELGSAASLRQSAERLARGSAALVGYYYQARRLSMRMVLKLTSREYSTSSLAPEDDRNLWEYSLSAGLTLGPHTSLSAQLGAAAPRDAALGARSSLSFTQQIARSVSGQILASRSQELGGDSSWEAFAQLSIALPFGHTAQLRERRSESGFETGGVISRAMTHTTDAGYQLSATAGQSPRQSVAIQAQSSFARVDASYLHGDGTSHTLLDASGTAVWVPHAGLFVSRPVYQSFAVVDVPRTPGVGVYLNNQRVGETSQSGKLFVPDLISYYGNRLRVDAEEAPSDLLIDDGEVLVAPPAHGGALVIFESRHLHLVRGQLVPEGIALDAVRYGDVTLTAEGERFSSPIGRDGEFELDGLPPGVYAGQALGRGGACAFTINVTGEAAVENRGAVRCKAVGKPPGARPAAAEPPRIEVPR